MRVAVYGAGGHGHDIAATLGDDFAGFYDDHIDHLTPPASSPYPVLIGVNDPQQRAELAARLDGWRFHDLGRWTHPAANIGPGVQLGRHSHVHAGAFLTRCTIGEFVTVAPNATILGDVTIGDRVLIGANATIRNLVTICSDVTIGAGAVVTADITEPGTYVGSPARRKPHNFFDEWPYAYLVDL